MMFTITNNNKGFTLVELIITIAVSSIVSLTLTSLMVLVLNIDNRISYDSYTNSKMSLTDTVIQNHLNLLTPQRLYIEVRDDYDNDEEGNLTTIIYLKHDTDINTSGNPYTNEVEEYITFYQSDINDDIFTYTDSNGVVTNLLPSAANILTGSYIEVYNAKNGESQSTNDFVLNSSDPDETPYCVKELGDLSKCSTVIIDIVLILEFDNTFGSFGKYHDLENKFEFRYIF